MTSIDCSTASVLPEVTTDTAAAQQALLVNRVYAQLLGSGTAVTTSQYVDALEERGTGEEAARARIKRDRGRRRLVTISHDGEALIPVFQLDASFDHDRKAGDAVARLLDAGFGPWGIWDWFETPNAWIDRRTPTECLRDGAAGALARALAAATGDGPDA